MTTGSLRFQPINLAPPSCQHQRESIFDSSSDCIGQNQEATAATCSKQPQKKTKEKIEEATASIAAGKEIGMDATTVAVLSEVDGIFTYIQVDYGAVNVAPIISHGTELRG